MRRARTVLISVAVVCPILVACGTDAGGEATNLVATGPTTSPQEPTSDASSNAPSTRTPTGTPTGGPADRPPAFPVTTTPQTAANWGEWDLVFTDLRVAKHEGFDR